MSGIVGDVAIARETPHVVAIATHRAAPSVTSRVAAEARALAARLRRESRPGEVFEAAAMLEAAAAEIDRLRRDGGEGGVSGARDGVPCGERGPKSTVAEVAA